MPSPYRRCRQCGVSYTRSRRCRECRAKNGEPSRWRDRIASLLLASDPERIARVAAMAERAAKKLPLFVGRRSGA